MVISCPACGTRYVVPDSAIGAGGRTVRCANCRHSWYQEGEVAAASRREAPPAASPATTPAAPATRPPPAPVRERAEDIPPPAPPPPPPTAPPLAENTARRDVVREPAADRSQFDHEPPFRPRRNKLKLLTWAAAIFAVLALATVAAANYWGLPDWVPVERPTFGQAEPDLVLEFPPDRQDRRTLPDGTEFFGISGSVTNVGERTRRVPPILIVLRDARDRIIYEYEIQPPQASLAPGESVSINEAALDVPRAARAAEIGWKPT